MSMVQISPPNYPLETAGRYGRTAYARLKSAQLLTVSEVLLNTHLSDARRAPRFVAGHLWSHGVWPPVKRKTLSWKTHAKRPYCFFPVETRIFPTRPGTGKSSATMTTEKRHTHTTRLPEFDYTRRVCTGSGHLRGYPQSYGPGKCGLLLSPTICIHGTRAFTR